jgi:hypothetical protein
MAFESTWPWSCTWVPECSDTTCTRLNLISQAEGGVIIHNTTHTSIEEPRKELPEADRCLECLLCAFDRHLPAVARSLSQPHADHLRSAFRRLPGRCPSNTHRRHSKHLSASGNSLLGSCMLVCTLSARSARFDLSTLELCCILADHIPGRCQHWSVNQLYPHDV